MSKRFIMVSLLILLASACTSQVTSVTPPPEELQSTQPAPSNTVESEPTLSIIAAWTDLALTNDAIVHPTFTATDTPAATATAAFALCPGAPGPYAALGKQAVVVSKDVDKLKVRSEPEISPDNVIGELDQFTELTIVGGPVCVRSSATSYWFWQVKVHPDGELGWVAEGDVQHPFIVVAVGQQFFPEKTPTAVATTASACPGSHAPISAGVEATVITEDSDKLKLRSEPKISPETVKMELDQFTRLQIVGGPLCVQSDETGIGYWLWKVKIISSGKTGWVAEGDAQNEFLDFHLPP